MWTFILNNWFWEILIIIFVISFRLNIKSIQIAQEELSELKKFKDSFIRFRNFFFKNDKGKIELNLYHYLIGNAYKMHRITFGMTTISFTSRVTNENCPKYDLCLNTIPLYKNRDIINISHKIELAQLSNIFIDCLMMSIGKKEDDLHFLLKNKYNPIVIASKPCFYLVDILNQLFGSKFIAEKMHTISIILSLIAYPMMIYFYSHHLK